MKASICIPVYEFHGKGIELLKHSLDIIAGQTYKNIQIVISDNSSDDIIRDFIKLHYDHVKYVRNDKALLHLATANFNNAISNADGDIIILSCQDDYFIADMAVERIVSAYSSPDVKWELVAHRAIKNDIFFLSYIPSWNDLIIRGYNYIGPPSVLSMRRGFECYFDTNVVYYSDCELYQQLYLKNDLPKIVKEYCVVYKVWDGQGSSYEKHQFDFAAEQAYIKGKYDLPVNAAFNKPIS